MLEAHNRVVVKRPSMLTTSNVTKFLGSPRLIAIGNATGF
jgi:hypothetical protein